MWVFELAARFRKELFLTGSALYETVFAIAERVNRKVQILRLHTQATHQLHYGQGVYREVGRVVAEQLEPVLAGVRSPPSRPLADLTPAVSQAAMRVKHSQETLLQIESRLRELKAEAAQEDMLAIQRDLSLRNAALERVVVMRGAPIGGHPLGHFHWPASTRVVAACRGPFLLPLSDTLQLRPGDVIVLIGLRDDLGQILPYFHRQPSAKSMVTREPA